MRECKKVKRLLSKYLDKEASIEDNILVEKHIEECFFCKNELSEFSSAKWLLRSKERKFLPQDYLVNRLRERLSRESYLEEKLSWFSAIGNFSLSLIPVPVVAIAVVVLLMISSPVSYVDKNSLNYSMLSSKTITMQTAVDLVFCERN